MSIKDAQSMDIACGFDACSTVDIIGLALFLKGGNFLFDLNRHDMNEDSFDAIPRCQLYGMDGARLGTTNQATTTVVGDARYILFYFYSICLLLS
jgi:hypothetical protein